MIISKHKLVVALGTCAMAFCAWRIASAQQHRPEAGRPDRASVTIRGESDRGVSMAIKNAVDKIPAPGGNGAKYFRVLSITGQKTAKSEKVVVELEVQDKPFESTAEK